MPSARGVGTLGCDSATETLFDFIDQSRCRFLREHPPFAACERSVGLVDHRDNLKTSALAFFPQSQRLADRLFLTAEPAAVAR
jgi:hypothetical protein